MLTASTPDFSWSSLWIGWTWGDYLNDFLPHDELMGAVSHKLLCIRSCPSGAFLCDTVSGCIEDVLVSNTGGPGVGSTVLSATSSLEPEGRRGPRSRTSAGGWDCAPGQSSAPPLGLFLRWKLELSHSPSPEALGQAASALQMGYSGNGDMPTSSPTFVSAPCIVEVSERPDPGLLFVAGAASLGPHPRGSAAFLSRSGQRHPDNGVSVRPVVSR